VEREHSIAATDGNYKRQMSGLTTEVLEHEKAPTEAGASGAQKTTANQR